MAELALLVDQSLPEAAREELYAALKTCRLDRRGLSSVDETLASLPSLQSLYLQHNCLASVSGLAHLSALRFLSMAHNRLTDLAGISALTTLMTLDVSHNSLASITPQDVPASTRFLMVAGNPCTAAAQAPATKRALVEALPLLRELDSRRVGSPLRHSLGLVTYGSSSSSEADEADEPASATAPVSDAPGVRRATSECTSSTATSRGTGQPAGRGSAKRVLQRKPSSTAAQPNAGRSLPVAAAKPRRESAPEAPEPALDVCADDTVDASPSEAFEATTARMEQALLALQTMQAVHLASVQQQVVQRTQRLTQRRDMDVKTVVPSSKTAAPPSEAPASKCSSGSSNVLCGEAPEQSTPACGPGSEPEDPREAAEDEPEEAMGPVEVSEPPVECSGVDAEQVPAFTPQPAARVQSAASSVPTLPQIKRASGRSLLRTASAGPAQHAASSPIVRRVASAGGQSLAPGVLQGQRTVSAGTGSVTSPQPGRLLGKSASAAAAQRARAGLGQQMGQLRGKG